MSTIFLIRHADKLAIPPDPGLNQLGHVQAQATARFLSQFPITTILSSPLRRAQETAEYTARALHLSIAIEEMLRERINWGDNPTLSRQNFIELWKKGTHDRDFSPPFGLSSRQAGENLATVIKQYSSAKNTMIAFFTHGGIIADFLRNLLPESALKDVRVPFDDGYDYAVKECSITTIHTGKNLRVESINSTDHLIA